MNAGKTRAFIQAFMSHTATVEDFDSQTQFAWRRDSGVARPAFAQAALAGCGNFLVD